MLTQEILKSNLGDLNETQIAKILELNKLDEEVVVSKAVSDNRKSMWDDLDRDILQATGMERNGLKSHEYLKLALSKIGDNKEYESLKTQYETLETEAQTLREQVKNGNGDQALKTQLATLEQRLIDKDGEITTLRTSLESERDEYKGKWEESTNGNLNWRIKSNISNAMTTQNVKLKTELPETLRERMYNLEMDEFLKNTKKGIEVVDGKETIVFRDENDQIIRDPKTIKPLSASELFLKRKGVVDLIDTGKSGAGAGSGAGSGAGGQNTSLDLSGATNQKEALKAVKLHIIQNEKIAITDPRYGERYDAIAKESGVLDLPVE